MKSRLKRARRQRRRANRAALAAFTEGALHFARRKVLVPEGETEAFLLTPARFVE